MFAREASSTHQESRKHRSRSGPSPDSKGLRPLPPTPKKQIAFEFKFTVKLKLEFDFDFDLISGSNFNKMVVKVVQISNLMRMGCIPDLKNAILGTKMAPK